MLQNLIQLTCWIAPGGYRLENRIIEGFRRYAREAELGHPIGQVEECLVRAGDPDDANFLLKSVTLGGERVYIDLANATTDQGLVDFANEWGLLENSPYEEPPLKCMRAAQATFAAVLKRKADALHRLILLAGDEHEVAGEFVRLGSLGAIINTNARRPSLHFEPYDLQEFCAIQALLDLSAGTRFLTCDECGVFLHRKTDKRSAVFCSNKCKVSAWRRNNPEEVERINRERREQRAAAAQRAIQKTPSKSAPRKPRKI